MKLFKSLLVAPATLGLLAPFAATANEVTINDFNPAEELAITNSRVVGLEARLNNVEAGSFSETTTAAFSADMYLGATDTDDATVTDDAVNAAYSFQIDLNTSFTGEDSLDISLDAGSSTATGVAEFDGNTGGDELTVDGVSYTFPLGDKTTVIAGIDTDGSALFTTACAYAGPGNLLDDCANVNAGITGGGATVGAAYDFGTGFTAAFGAQTTEASVFTQESQDAYALNLAYTADKYGIALTYSSVSSGIGSGATIDIVVGQGSSIIDFEIRNTGYGFKSGEKLTVPIGGLTGIPTTSTYRESLIDVQKVFTDEFTAWSLGTLQVLDNLDDLFDGSTVAFSLRDSGSLITIRAAKLPSIFKRNANLCIRMPTPSDAEKNCATIVPIKAPVIASFSPAMMIGSALGI